MGWEEEIIGLLREIKEQQKNHYEEWRKAIAASTEQQKKAAEEARKVARRVLWKVMIIIVAMIVIFFFLSTGGSLSRLFTGCGYSPHSFLQNGRYYEAKEWLNNNKNESPLASNRFGAKENALKFVESLYETGAEGVYVVNVTDAERTIKDEGGPYADSLVVRLPSDKDRRKKLFVIYAEESKREGFDSVSDFGQKELFFWWD
jgi:hypothetical protein